MAAPSSSLVDELSKLAECPVCFGLKGDNKLLFPCGHSLCKECLESICARTTEKLCPKCKKAFQIPSNGKFSKDSQKEHLIELLPFRNTKN